MVNHPNRNWRKRWQFDAIALTATHDSGLVIKFEESVDCPGAYDSSIVGEIPDSLIYDYHKVLAKMMRQAGDGMLEAIEKQNEID